ncbi:hypothetical protein PRUPE_5G190800 [Prunus persica]|uniref:Uncharacterized protein n=1 Tax=Prunus persica TaxID=3760 RepID=M5WF18_PRUPE|nr:hypothetical protein PRUPE_5G190800 [Prunus persica]
MKGWWDYEQQRHSFIMRQCEATWCISIAKALSIIWYHGGSENISTFCRRCAPSGQDILDRALTMASREDELLGKISEIEKSLAALSTQQIQLVDLKKSIWEEFHLLGASRASSHKYGRSPLPKYDAAILHTSFARLLGHPKASSTMLSNTGDQVHFFHGLVDRLNNELRGFEAVVSELWYVEEFDVLALALNGRMKMRRFQLGCSRN